VEHAFRDFKSDHIQVRPVYHRNEAQTRGHVLLSMFSYAIVKEMEDNIFPFLAIWNKKTKSKLSFSDILEELKDIKLVKLDVGRNTESIKLTELNELQEQVLKLFNMKKIDMEKHL
jgi:transposase